MSAANIEMKCFSAAQRACSFPVFKARAAILQLCDRRARVSRPTVCLSAVVLRTREPLESASRPIPQIVGGKDDEFRKGDIGEDAQNSAIKSNYSVGVDHETSDKVSNGGVIEDDHSNDGNGSIIQNDKCEPINNCNHHLGLTSAMSSNVNSEASTVIDERERLRRERIGRANKGKVPWNKGKHHKPETIARLRERNKIVMADPKMRERLRQFSHPQSQETREKIRTFMKSRMEFERRQLTIVQEWKDSVASLARRGILGDDELQWDSYQKLKKELHKEYYSSKRKKKKAAAPKSLQMEHRLRISEAIRAKWTDPDYRGRVVERMQATKSEGQRTLSSRLHDDQEFDLILNSLTRDSPELPPSEPKLGSYNDPLSSEKLKRIRMLRSQNIVKKEPDLETKSADSHFSNFKVADSVSCVDKRGKPAVLDDSRSQSTLYSSTQVTDTEELEQAQFEARERARILLAEAEQAAIIAAQAIDAAGTHGESLNDSLLEAWALLDEANRSISKLKMTTMSTN